ncbi:MAG: zf-HC2 domain-containing protein [Planctomycetes bacterium]|nr:zf-HC2 domain-containing protein [Planctomycetota bacterium]
MDCNRIRELLINTLYGSLDKETAREVDEHLAGCPACRRQVEESRALLKGYRAAPKPEAPTGGIAAALEAGRKTRAEIAEKQKTRRIVRDSFLKRFIFSPGMATAALFLIIISIFFYSTDSEPEYTSRMAKGLDKAKQEEAEGEVLLPKPDAAPAAPVAKTTIAPVEAARLAEAETADLEGDLKSNYGITAVEPEAAPGEMAKLAEAEPTSLEAGAEIKDGITLVEPEATPKSDENFDFAAYGERQSAPSDAAPGRPAIAQMATSLPPEEEPEVNRGFAAVPASSVAGVGEVPARKQADLVLRDNIESPIDKDEPVFGSIAGVERKTEVLAEDSYSAPQPAVQPAKELVMGREASEEVSRRRTAPKAIRIGGAVELQLPALTARIWSEQDTFSVAEPIIIQYEVKNTGSEAVVLWLDGFWPNHRIEVLDEKGKPVAMTEAGKKCDAAFTPQGERDPENALTLAPGEADMELTPFDLREFFQLETPGTYTVRYLYQEEAPGGWRGRVWSNPLTIKVTEE